MVSSAQSTTTAKLDYSKLYKNLGDTVIQLAYDGDEYCQKIYKRAWQQTTAHTNENNNAGSPGGKTTEPVADGDGLLNVHYRTR